MIRIAFIGSQGAGKTSTSTLLGEKLKMERDISMTKLSFAEALRREVSQALGTSQLSAEQIYRETKDIKLKRRWTPVLQFWGTEIRRNHFGQNYWADQLEAQINELSVNEAIFVDDCRFNNEHAMLVKRGFKFIRLTSRGDLDRIIGIEQHSSEQDWKRWRVDLVVPWKEAQLDRVNYIYDWLEARNSFD